MSQLLAGLAASVALLALAILLIQLPSSWTAYDLRSVFDSAGVLELTWLFGNEPALAKVRHPTLRALRAAGMYEVQLSERAQEKVYLAEEIDRAESVLESSGLTLTSNNSGVVTEEKVEDDCEVSEDSPFVRSMDSSE